MGVRNYLIDGGSGTGKTTVCDELQRRGYQAVHGDRELRAAGTPAYDLPPVWDLKKVRALIAGRDEPVTFFCGGCSNSSEFIDLLDGVFVLEVDDLDIIMRRIDERVAVDPTDWGGRTEERDIIVRRHYAKDCIANGRPVDATAPLEHVVREILRRVHSHD